MLMASKTYSAPELARLVRCTIEQLNYYHEIRLLSFRHGCFGHCSMGPVSSRTGPLQCRGQGCLEYDDVGLLRLQQIRMGRARGLALEEIRRLLDGCDCKLPPSASCTRASRRRKPSHLHRLYTETEAKVETEADCDAFQHEATDLYRSLSARRRSGAAPTDDRLSRWVERHRYHIDRWFCPCDGHAHLAFARAIAQNPYLASDIERHGRHLTSFAIAVIEAHTP
jgi:DNA-binding transcriptional MerR regulator